MKNLKILIEILKLQAESNCFVSQNLLIKSVIAIIKKHSNFDFDHYFDDSGNCYFTKGNSDNFPCIVAHVDQVHDIQEKYTIFQDENVLFAFNGVEQCGIGGDDKTGIYAAVMSFLKFDSIKMVLFTDEEIGCVGSTYCDMEFFKDCSFVGQLDRNHQTNDFITHTNGTETTSSKFDKEVLELLVKYGFEFSRGSVTDVGQLVNNGIGICCFNMSAGYLYAHTASEIIDIEKLWLSMDLLDELIIKLSSKKWKFKPTKNYYPKSWYGLRSIKKTAKKFSYQDHYDSIGYYDSDSLGDDDIVYEDDDIECVACGITFSPHDNSCLCEFCKY